jgi:large-conductance mechanosensitive channel
MDDSVKASEPGRGDAGNWVGRIIVAVILGEAIWNLIVSVMNNLVVPWLGDAMGQSSGLPTSFTQRPYNYPDLFVAVVEFCIAGIVAATLNHFLQRSKAGKVKVKSLAGSASVEPVRVVPVSVPTTPAPMAQVSRVQVPIQAPTAQPPVTHSVSQIPPSPSPVSPSPTIQEAAPRAPKTVPDVAPAPPTPLAPAAVAAMASEPVTVASSAPSAPDSVEKHMPPAPKPPASKVEPAKPKKPRQVYYNIVGEPVSSDDD